jgi:hypothetical protein
MVVTGIIRGDELDRVSGEGPDYEAAKAEMVSRVPDGYALLAIYAGEHYPKD